MYNYSDFKLVTTVEIYAFSFKIKEQTQLTVR